MKNKNIKNITTIILLILIILILLYLLIRNFGNIENQSPKVPTGNVDIFEINCICDSCDNTKVVFKGKSGTNKKNSKAPTQEEKTIPTYEEKDEEIEEETEDYIEVFDDYKIWDNRDLRIFSNPAFEYESIIAPGSENSYAFVIRNDNDFDLIFDINFSERNQKNINMKYKLKNNGNYLVGSENKYEFINNKKITQIEIPAKSQEAYILDWKWIDSDNDTSAGIDANSNYKLSISIGANQI